jgi:small subunit ribosomal protein S20
MPNTKSAERRMRNSARKQTRNSSIKSRLKTAEKGYLELLSTGKKDEAAAALRKVTSFYDKAAKTGIVHSRTASRKKSRLALRLNKASAPAAAATK